MGTLQPVSMHASSLGRPEAMDFDFSISAWWREWRSGGEADAAADGGLRPRARAAEGVQVGAPAAQSGALMTLGSMATPGKFSLQ